MNTVVWLLVIYNIHSNGISTGPEFTTKARCEAAATTIVNDVEVTRWGISPLRRPICVRIEK